MLIQSLVELLGEFLLGLPHHSPKKHPAFGFWYWCGWLVVGLIGLVTSILLSLLVFIWKQGTGWEWKDWLMFLLILFTALFWIWRFLRATVAMLRATGEYRKRKGQ